MEAGRADPDQYLVVGDLGCGDPGQAQNLGGAVRVLHDGLHRAFGRDLVTAGVFLLGCRSHLCSLLV